ncbi:MAG: hypothetical protein IKX30_05410 [Victivallales bacterium]|nr:hypothetical protein [Victivallales bacterium]
MKSSFHLSNFILFCVLLFVPVLLSSCFSIIDARANTAHDAMAAQVMERIHLGMDIDEAIALLKKEGFVVREKEKWEDCHYDYQTMYRASVDLEGSSHIPWNVTFRYVLDIPCDQRPWLNITASLDGKIVRISRDP